MSVGHPNGDAERTFESMNLEPWGYSETGDMNQEVVNIWVVFKL